MKSTARNVRIAIVSLAMLGFTGLTACRLDRILVVPGPLGVSSSEQLANQRGAEETFVGARSGLYNDLYGSGNLVNTTAFLADEFTYAAFTYGASSANVDARQTAGFGGFQEYTDYLWADVLHDRSSLLVALAGLKGNEPSKVGEAYALIGYSELFLAEAYCSGTILSQILPNGGFELGTVALTDDSLLGVAQAAFDSALAHTSGSDTAQNLMVQNLASIGLGRVLLDRASSPSQLAAAGTAVQGVPASFVFNAEFAPNAQSGVYFFNFYNSAVINDGSANFVVADHKGGNGLNFVSANDPRLVLGTSYVTQDGAQAAPQVTSNLPNKFAVNFAYVPMATGVEAALIRAEVALGGNDAATWLNDLNALRTNGAFTVSGTDTTWGLGSGQVAGQATGLRPLVDPGTDTGRVSLMFRERAFWLFGTGSRLGDLRRLVRQYNRDTSLVYPHGVYPNGTNANLPAPIPTYGLDVDFTLPTLMEIQKGNFTETNPAYKGCLTPTTQA